MRDGANVLLRRRTTDLDAMGHITAIHDYFDSTHCLTTRMEYDSCGNITVLRSPNTTTYFAYDSIANTYPVSVTDTFGIASYMQDYDYRFGVPRTIVDRAGNRMEYTLDAWGRTLTIRGPKEIAANQPYTLRFSYFGKDSLKAYASSLTEHYDPQHPGNSIKVRTYCDGLGRIVQTRKEAEIGGMGTLVERAIADTAFHVRPVRKIRIKTATKVIEQKSGMNVCNIETPWRKSEKLLGEILYNNIFDASSCTTEFSKLREKTVSLDFMASKKQTLLINFSDTTIALLDSNMVYDTIGFVRLNAYFKLGTPVIRVSVDDSIHDFYFDTGSNGELMLNNSNLTVTENDRILYGYIGEDISGSIYDSVIFRMSTIKTDTNYPHQCEVSYVKSLNHNNMGMKFISHYDWIIDRKNSRVYAKLIRPFESCEMMKTTLYKVGVVEDRLEIVTHRLGQDSLLPIGTVVKSVNGVAVTPENICEYKDLANQLLNKDGKWWELDIVFEEKK